MKLSKAQQTVIDKAKSEIDYARTHDFRHWIAKARGYDLNEDYDAIPNKFLTNESVAKIIDEMEAEAKNDPFWVRHYEEEKRGIVLTHCNSRTLIKLEELGLIEIIRDSNGSRSGIDIIRLINY